ncbi:MAG: TolC family protein [Bacteroidetes bacterium]|nr:TolC family protein [Bacteroidota bacterium]
MKKIMFAFAVFMAFHSQAQTLTIEACQDSALKNYPLIQQFGLIEKTKELTLSNANKNYLPQLDVTLIGGIIEGMPSFALPGAESSASTEVNLISMIQLNQVLWDGGMTKASKGIIEANSEIEKADLEVNLYQLKDRVNNLYFGILLINEQMAQLDLLEETLMLNQKRIQNAIENGTAFKSDADELKVELINIDQKKAELLYNKEAYLAVLSAMTGEKITRETNFVRPDFSSTLEDISINRPEMIKFKNQQSLIESQAKLNKATLIPKFGLMGFGVFITPGVDFGTSELTNIFVAGLSLSWQLGPLYKNANNKKITEISMQRIQNQEETFLFNTHLELNQTDKELEKYHKLLEMDREILLLKSSIKDAYLVKYDNGVATMTDVLQRINDESVAKQMMIMHEIQYLMKAYQYLNKSGN